MVQFTRFRLCDSRCVKIEVLTAGHPQGAGLLVQRVQLEVHGTRQSERDTDAVQDSPVRKDPDVHVGHDDIVKVAFLLVREEQVGHPNPVGLGQRQVFETTWR